MVGTLLDARQEILSKLTNPVLFDIGCGQVPAEGFIGIDLLSPREDVRKIDLYTYPWPIESASVDYFRSSHFLEHVPDWDAHFTEIYRCLKPGGHYEIIAPYYRNDRWFQDPDHKQAILHNRFSYLNRHWKKANKIDHYGAAVNFEVYKGVWFELLHEDFRDQGFDADYIRWWKAHGWNVIEDLAVIVVKLPMEE